jgi:hypothetical protein
MGGAEQVEVDLGIGIERVARRRKAAGVKLESAAQRSDSRGSDAGEKVMTLLFFDVARGNPRWS